MGLLDLKYNIFILSFPDKYTLAIHPNNNTKMYMQYMQIMYTYITYYIGNNLNIIDLVIHLQSHCPCISQQFDLHVNATDISAHCDTMSQKRNLNPLCSFI